MMNPLFFFLPTIFQVSHVAFPRPQPSQGIFQKLKSTGVVARVEAEMDETDQKSHWAIQLQAEK